MAPASPEEYITLIPVRDLIPQVRQAVEEWRASTDPTPERLNELVRGLFSGFGPGVTARLVPGPGVDEDILRITLTITPGADEARAAQVYEKGMVHAHSGRLDRALVLFREAVELWPFEPDYHRSRAQAALELGLLPEAEDAFLAGLRLHPQDWAALTMLGNLYYTKGQLKLAKSLHEQSLAAHESPYALTNLGAVLAKEGQIGAARRLYERALQVDPSYQQARVGLSLCDSQQQ